MSIWFLLSHNKDKNIIFVLPALNLWIRAYLKSAKLHFCYSLQLELLKNTTKMNEKKNYNNNKIKKKARERINTQWESQFKINMSSLFEADVLQRVMVSHYYDYCYYSVSQHCCLFIHIHVILFFFFSHINGLKMALTSCTIFILIVFKRY